MSAARGEQVVGFRVVDGGAYERIGTYAEGGIGRILRARDRRLDRPVALKELLKADAAAEDRFVREALLTARLQHPGVVPIYEAGRWPSGELFYAMRLVEGRPLLDRIAAAPALDQRLGLLPHVIAIAETMAYAHSQRIIHRDLKPENVLIGEYGETVVIDWGLAKDLAAEEGEAPARAAAPSRGPASAGSTGRRRIGGENLTMVGAVMGTPAYMPPEQAYGDPVDARADVYAIGAVLYHVIAGAPPYEAETPAALLTKVMTEEPAPLETRQPGAPRELVTIVRKAMAERSVDRYPSAKELAEDLRRFQAGQFVAAHHYSRAARLRRLLRRYRAPLAVGGVALVLLATLGMLSLARIFEARDALELARADAERRADALALEHARSAATTQPIRALELLAEIRDTREWRRLRVIAADAHQSGVGASLVGHEGAISRIVFSPDGRSVVTTSDDCLARIWDLDGRGSRALIGHTDEVWRAAFSPDGARVATSSRDGSVRVWEAATGAPLAVLPGDEHGTRALSYTYDGAALLVGRDDDRLLRWEPATGAVTEIERCLAGSFVSDGRRVACGEIDRLGVVLHDLSEGTRFRLAVGRPINPITALSPTREVLAVASSGKVLLWSWRDGAVEELAGPPLPSRAMAFSADGDELAVSTKSQAIWRWRGGERLPDLELPGGEPRRLIFTGDGGHLFAAGGDTRVHLWRLSDGMRRAFTGFPDSVSALALAPKDERVAAASSDGSARIWRLDGLLEARVGGLATTTMVDQARAIGITGHADGRVVAWDLALRRWSRPLWSASPREAAPSALTTLPTKDHFVVGYRDGVVVMLDKEGRRAGEMTLAAGAEITRLSGSPTGEHLLAVTNGGAEVGLSVVGLASGQRRRLTDVAGVTWVWLDADSLAVSDRGPEVAIFDVAAGTRRALLRDELGLMQVALADDGRRLIAGGPSHTLRVYERETGLVGALNLPNITGVRSLAAIPGGPRVLVAGAGVRVAIWDSAAGAHVGALSGGDVPIQLVRVSADGRSAATAAEDGAVKLWDLGSTEGRLLGVVASRISELSLVGPVVAAHAEDGLHLWLDELPDEEQAFLEWLRMSGQALTLRSSRPAVAPSCAAVARNRAPPQAPLGTP
ncbi:MAG: protein kinase [Nannocystis sp.]|nr:protein kinase [Nannocystis sp.]